MSLPIITADQRLAEPRGIKGCIFGKSGIGKTSLLWTLDPARTLFIDLEAGDLAIEGWPGDSIRPRTWAECRDFAVFIGGPNPALRDEQPYSPAHHAAVCQKFGDPAALDRYDTIFVDSITVAGRLCFQWCKGQPEAVSEKTGKPDVRGAYGLHGREMIAWLTHLQHTRGRNVWFVGILDEKFDDFNRRIFQPQIDGSKTGLELPGIREIFDNVGDQVRLSELIASGHLVPPRTFVIDVGVQEQLRAVRKSAADYDMTEVAQIMNRAPVTDEVVRHWQEKASGRPTVVFCSTVAHAENVTAAFNAAGISAAVIHGDLDAGTRPRILAAYASGEIRVIVNVAVLTEGWDHPPTSCVVLLRPSSYKSTMIQMVGRGLRTVDPEEYPGVIKTDCIVLDFGTSSLIHGTLEQDVDLDGKTATGEAPTKTCPACEAEIPLAAMECPLCGEVFARDLEESGEGQDAIPLSGFIMSEIDLLKRSSFAWVDLFGDDAALMANGFNAWGGIFFLDGRWHAVGGAKGRAPRLLGVGERAVCLAQADDWLNEYETDESAFKSKGWLKQAATEKQLQYLPPEFRQDYGLTRYRASALMTFGFNKREIRQLVGRASPDIGRAA